MSFKSCLLCVSMLAMGSPVLAKNILLPEPVVLSRETMGEDAASRRKFINRYIDSYISEYIAEFMRINRTSENRFNVPQIRDKLKKIYSGKSDAQIMSVSEKDVMVLKIEMDDIALSSYARSELTRLNAMTVDTSMAKIIVDLNKRIDSLGSRLDQNNRSISDVVAQIKKLQEDLVRVKSTAVLSQTRAALTTPAVAAVPENPVAEPPSKTPMILSIAALLAAGFAVMSSRRA